MSCDTAFSLIISKFLLAGQRLATSSPTFLALISGISVEAVSALCCQSQIRAATAYSLTSSERFCHNSAQSESSNPGIYVQIPPLSLSFHGRFYLNRHRFPRTIVCGKCEQRHHRGIQH